MRTAEDKLKGILPYAAKRAIKIKLKKKIIKEHIMHELGIIVHITKRFKMLQKKTI